MITIACNWGTINNLPPDDGEKLIVLGKMALHTPYRLARSTLDSFTYWQESGFTNTGAAGWMVICGLGLISLFKFLHGLVAWFIGAVHAPASEERKSIIAFVVVLIMIALAVSYPFDPNIVASVLIFLVTMWILIKFLKYKFRKRKV